MTESRRHSYHTAVFAVLAVLLVGAALWLVVLTGGAGTKQFFVAQAFLDWLLIPAFPMWMPVHGMRML